MSMYRDDLKRLLTVPRLRIPEPDNVRLRLQRNERPHDWPVEFRQAVLGNMPSWILQRYPDLEPFYAKLARFLGVPREALVLTDGIDGAIREILLLACKPGQRYAGIFPGYAMYKVYGDLLDLEFTPIEYDPRRFLEPEALLARLPEGCRVLFLPNPSQPIENCFSLVQMRAIAEGCRARNTLLCIDEAYAYFGAESAIPLTGACDNVLVMRSMSKAFGAAGLRIGFLIGGERAIAPLEHFRRACEATSLTLHVAAAMIDRFDSDILPAVAEICAGRDRLRELCAAAGVPAWGSVSNNVLIELESPDTVRAVVQRLATQGIYVKGGFAPPIAACLLVTAGPPTMMEEFFAAFLAARSAASR